MSEGLVGETIGDEDLDQDDQVHGPRHVSKGAFSEALCCACRSEFQQGVCAIFNSPGVVSGYKVPVALESLLQTLLHSIIHSHLRSLPVQME
jgi:hypothetical protein